MPSSRGRPVIVVGTPGRLNDLLALSNPPVFNLNSCGYLVLDEADRMLDMGFEPQIKSVVAKLPSARQTLFFTATWPREVKGMAASYLKKDAVQIFVGGADNKLVANKAVTQKFVELQDAEKPAELKKVIDEAGPEAKVMVFCNMKRDCERLLQEQRKLGRGTCAIHGDKEQWEREQALHSFTSGRCPIMFATDVAARGLDVRGVALVVNYDLPTGDDGVESYVHRIGRTGRAGATGLAVSFWNAKTEKRHAPQYLQLLRDAGQEARAHNDIRRSRKRACPACMRHSLSSDTPCCSLLSCVCCCCMQVPDFIEIAAMSKQRGGGGKGWWNRGGGGKGGGRGKGGGKGKGGGGGKGWGRRGRKGWRPRRRMEVVRERECGRSLCVSVERLWAKRCTVRPEVLCARVASA